MTAAVIYDSNYSVPVHVHRPTLESIAGGEALICEQCGSELVVACVNGCADPLEEVRKSRGPVPPAPTVPEKKYSARQCANCSSSLPRGYKGMRCEKCRARLTFRKCVDCENAALARKARCEHCDANRKQAKRLGRIAKKRERTPAELRQREIGLALRGGMLRSRVGTDELARELGKSPSTITCWETGNVAIPRALIPVLARQFRLEESQLTNELHTTTRTRRAVA